MQDEQMNTVIVISTLLALTFIVKCLSISRCSSLFWELRSRVNRKLICLTEELLDKSTRLKFVTATENNGNRIRLQQDCAVMMNRGALQYALLYSYSKAVSNGYSVIVC